MSETESFLTKWERVIKNSPSLSDDQLTRKLAKSHPSLTRGQVWCRSCGSTRLVDSAGALRSGWPKCCGHTMTIDSPEEQKLLANGQGPSNG